MIIKSLVKSIVGVLITKAVIVVAWDLIEKKFGEVKDKVPAKPEEKSTTEESVPTSASKEVKDEVSKVSVNQTVEKTPVKSATKSKAAPKKASTTESAKKTPRKVVAKKVAVPKTKE